MPSQHILNSNATIYDALEALNGLSGTSLTLFVTDDNDNVIGTMTDGDIRRALIAGATPDSNVSAAIHHNFIAIRDNQNPLPVIDLAKSRKIRLIPLLKNNKIVKLLDLNTIKSLLPLDAVLMAGGRGERLRPLTDSTPKPLLPIAGKPIIDYNIDELIANGISSIFITVNYLKEQIVRHFSSPRPGTLINCIAEPKRLGTIGSLSLVAPSLSHDNFILMNSDLLTSLDFDAMYRHHIKTNADVTIAAVQYSHTVPYAVMQTDGDFIKEIREKPSFNYLANGGVYIIRRNLVDKIPADTFLDAPDFIDSLLRERRKISYFPIDGTWIDIGSPTDYSYADKLMSNASDAPSYTAKF
ncbi:MAG: sugar phosphate nucleotidyltransferase [Prevotella sp.]|nr:sugar phosphate nucleotidyltransferase [Bacteroides sp.]MCM1366973.1 sugar phosphate nucleotidyltransferase [Prevotella sp.]MCM1437482.1 sugar phosphate nucleotidyltransferase [Prevotella sp.]